jgi:hypothetical protein
VDKEDDRFGMLKQKVQELSKLGAVTRALEERFEDAVAAARFAVGMDREDENAREILKLVVSMSNSAKTDAKEE